ncbi:MAG: tRNA glutamyl-Q(34) synthetase GluQRS, partial [Woeseiaceae bacterium]|nr:tRNA glutamyl-Q(34) synthetase GluQRS [Woeseiaceae bacterium]
LVRIEDVDPPREHPGAADMILEALEAYGFEWDGAVIYQSRSRDAHLQALARLLEENLAYPCGCSRKDLAHVPRGPLGTIYPGTCRNGTTARETATRVRTSDEPVTFVDGLQGRQSQRLESEGGDFVIFRRDGLVAYHLAVVVDDHLQGITEIVRGIDLMDSTPRQIWLQRLLGYATPHYQHIPVAVHPDGSKLSKLTGAVALPLDRVVAVLVAALRALGQRPPTELTTSPVAEVWNWALKHWQIKVLEGHTIVEENPLR